MFPIALKRYSSTWLSKSGKVLVSTEELAKSLYSKTENVVILDASWHMPNERKCGKTEHENKRIPTSQFFDIDAISDPAGSSTNPLGLPHQMPNDEMFRQATAELGVLSDDIPIVIYDNKGMFSSARAWYMFHTFGHRSVYLLDGGLPLWEAESREIVSGVSVDVETDDGDSHGTVSDCAATLNLFGDDGSELDHRVSVKLDDSMVRDYEQVLDHVRKRNAIILDARSSERFNGVAPEPREGLRSGNIPTSISLPFDNILNKYTLNNIEVTQFKSKKEIRSIIIEATKNTTATFGKAGEGFSAGGLTSARRPIVTTCGSGVTACILAAGLRIAGFDHTLALYDGSWSEWGMKDDPDDIVA
jgi:thiosulfate/3-mercaptopyruvate sulfurtransferase